MRPDTSAPRGWSHDVGFDALLRAVSGRVRLADAATSLAGAAVAGAIVTAVILPRGRALALAVSLPIAAMVAGARWWRRRSTHTSTAAAARVEQLHPQLRNVLITAEELRLHPDRASDWVRERVAREATAATSELDAAGVVPIAKPLAIATAALVLWIAVVAGLPQRAGKTAKEALAEWRSNGATAADASAEISAQLRPPAYTGLPVRELSNPTRIDAVDGTTLYLRVSGGELPWRVRFGDRTLTPVRDASRSDVTVSITLTESGYLAIEPGGPESAQPVDRRRILLPVSVTSDNAPSIRIEAPARDLLLPPSAATVPVSAVATDDFGLQSLELRYTKVSGAGEQFEFREGTLPLSIRRESERAWKGQVELALRTLNLAPGDTLVYRAVGRDRRAGDAGLSSSDTFFVEIQGPGQVALEGIEMPPEQERYALSQQMVVLKIERLRAAERAMAPAALAEQTAAIAAEQRAVRANFIFLMGGHVEDEFEEAEHSNEIQEGRLENTARKDISIAIHHMTLAEQGLTGMSTSRALPPAKAAVEALQRAFGRNRYILRTLASRSRIDPSRRLSGSLAAASSWRRDLAQPADDRTAGAALAMMSDLMRISAALRKGEVVTRERVQLLAERALSIEPGSAQWQAIAAKLISLADLVAAQAEGTAVVAALNAALAPVVAIAERDARVPPLAPVRSGTLHSAWAAEVRK